MRRIIIVGLLICTCLLIFGLSSPPKLGLETDKNPKITAGDKVVLKGTVTHRLYRSLDFKQTEGPLVELQKAGDTAAFFTAPDTEIPIRITFECVVTPWVGNRHIQKRITLTVHPDDPLMDVRLAFLSQPTVDQKLQVRIHSEIDLDELRPDLRHLGQRVAFRQQGDTLSFIPDTAGDYRFILSYRMKERNFDFQVKHHFPFSTDNVEIMNDQPLNRGLGFVRNQFWVSSAKLSEQAVYRTIRSFNSFRILGSDPAQGVLIETPDESTETRRNLEKLVRSQGISFVLPRMYEGEDLTRIEFGTPAIYTNDYDQWSKKPNDNWHLVHIEAPKAWAITRGHPDVYLGISDAGFDPSHVELENKIHINHVSHAATNLQDHGNAVAGTLAGVSDNGYGISGINFKSPLVLQAGNFQGWQRLAQMPRVKVINASWAMAGYTDVTFNPADPVARHKRLQRAFALTRNFRRIAKNHPDKLFVFSAGNGIGNGKGNGKTWGLDGTLHSPALHLSGLNTVDKQDNVLFAGALTYGEKLSYTSNYGPLVDLAAPAYFKSTKARGGFKDNTEGRFGFSAGFKGTSAAAPVVSGIASLIFAINPSFTGREVRDILLQSAKERVTHRYKSPSGGKEPLSVSLPVVNAYKALKLAKARSSAKWRVSLDMGNPFAGKKKVTIEALNKRTHNLDVLARFYPSEEEEATEIVTTSQNEFVIDLSEADTFNRLETEISTVSNDNLITTDLSIGRINLSLFDHDELHPLTEASIRIESLEKATSFPEGKTDVAGRRTLLLPAGSYKLYFRVPGYQQSTKTIHLSASETLGMDIGLVEISDGNYGILEGYTFDSDLNPLPRARVKLTARGTGSQQGDPIEFLAITDHTGYFSILDIPEFGPDNKGLKYMIEATYQDLSSIPETDIIMLSGQTHTRNLRLYKVQTTSAFSDMESP